MKNADGFHLDISQTDQGPQQDTIGIRVNVDNFDEVYELLKAKGFTNVYGDNLAITKTSKSAMM